MAITDDLRKTLTSTTPLYVAAGTADLAAQKLRELPATIDRLRVEAPERLPKLREQAQNAALQGVGRALEYALKARETYEELAERGKGVVERRRTEEQPAGDAAETDITVERAAAPATEPVTEPAAEPVTEPAAAEAPKAPEEGTVPGPRTRKTTARKAAPKSPRAPKKMPPQA